MKDKSFTPRFASFAAQKAVRRFRRAEPDTIPNERKLSQGESYGSK
ncbi:MAG: hypothetical protein LUJ25_08235 [Firmicutes bacterium]|nr:hypothetical protein [Bacillota bacterium]